MEHKGTQVGISKNHTFINFLDNHTCDQGTITERNHRLEILADFTFVDVSMSNPNSAALCQKTPTPQNIQIARKIYDKNPNPQIHYKSLAIPP